MAKRSTTDLSLVVGVDKPAGMSSHDVVNRVRRIFGERRCGHMGTLDPAATGALAVCVGPATRLNALLTRHDKVYEFTIVFGAQTDTDDAQGSVIGTASIPDCVYDEDFARTYLEGIVGPCKQMPPAYSAIKVGGQRSYEAARKGGSVELTPRDVEILSAQLVGIEDPREASSHRAPSQDASAQGASSLDASAQGALSPGASAQGAASQDASAPDALREPFVPSGQDPIAWRVVAAVSAGTYVRSIARDVGRDLGTCAHVGDLRRLQAGNLVVDNCVSLEELAADPFGSVLDPVKLLGLRFTYLDERQAADISVGKVLSVKGMRLYCYELAAAINVDFDSCTSGVVECFDPLKDGERVCLIVDNKVQAIYQFDQKRGVLKSACGFVNGVARVGRI